MIWRVIGKDFKSLWWLGPSLIAAAALYGFSYAYRFQHPYSDVNGFLVTALPYLAAILPLARAVQLDSPASRRADWHTRPINRWSLLAAKLIIGWVGIVLPWGLIDFFVGLSWGLPAADCLAASAMHVLAMSGALVLVIAVASNFSSLIQFLLAGGGLALAASLIRAYVLIPLIRPFGASWPNSALLLDASIGWPMALLAIAGLTACLFVLYHRRAILAGRLLLVLATLGVEVVGLGAAEIHGRIWRPIPGPEPAIAQGVSVAFDPSQPQLRTYDHFQGLRRQIMALVPLKVQAPDGVMLSSDWTLITQTLPGGAKQHWAEMTGTLGRQNLDFGYNDFPDLGPAVLNVKMRLSLRKLVGFQPLPIDGQAHLVEGLGVCRAWQSRGDANFRSRRVLLRCLAPERGARSTSLWNNQRQMTEMFIPHGLQPPFVAYAESGDESASQTDPLQAGVYEILGEIERDFSTPVVKLSDLASTHAPEGPINPAWEKDILSQRPPNMPPRTLPPRPAPSPPVNAK